MVFLEQVVRMLFVSVQDWVLLYKTSTAVLDLLRGEEEKFDSIGKGRSGA